MIYKNQNKGSSDIRASFIYIQRRIDLLLGCGELVQVDILNLIWRVITNTFNILSRRCTYDKDAECRRPKPLISLGQTQSRVAY